MDEYGALAALETGDLGNLIDALDWDEREDRVIDPPAFLVESLGATPIHATVCRRGNTVLTYQVGGADGAKGMLTLHGPHADTDNAHACYLAMIAGLADEADAIDHASAEVDAMTVATPSGLVLAQPPTPTGLYL